MLGVDRPRLAESVDGPDECVMAFAPSSTRRSGSTLSGQQRLIMNFVSQYRRPSGASQ
jgi:hypothetical protein